MVDTSFAGVEAAPAASSADEIARVRVRDQMRRAAAARPFAAYMIFVTVLAALYYGLVATPQYVSETQFAIRSREIAAPTGFLSGLLGTTTGNTDLQTVSYYVRSHDMLKVLQDRLDLRSQYAQPRLDPFQNMSKTASPERFLAFYRRHITVKLDQEAQTLTIVVKAFDPKSSEATATAILEQTEQFVNGLSQRLKDESLKSATAEYTRAQKNAAEKRNAVVNFQGVHSDLNPTMTGGFLVSSLGTLQSAEISLQSQLAALQTYSKPDSPAVQQLQAQLVNVRRQIGLTKNQQGSGSSKPQQVTSFEALELDRTAAEGMLNTSQTAYNSARADAEQREKFVVRVVTPNMPKTATAPNRLLEFATVLLFALAGYALVSLTVAAIRDHQGI